MWWWVMPLIDTGILCFVIALFWLWLFKDCDKVWANVIFVLLLLPIVFGGISFLVNIIVACLIHIWTMQAF